MANLLYEQIKLSPLIVEERISTIFLDGKPVDDITSVVVEHGSTLALSGAMPGLVGATLRRKSPLASFRQSISARKASEELKEARGSVNIKLFNILLDELGLVFLERGVFLRADILMSFFEKQSWEFWRRCKQIMVNGSFVRPQKQTEWCQQTANSDLVNFKVIRES